MSVPYVFASLPNGTAIPLSYLDDNFLYVTTSPTFSGNVTITGTLGVGGAVTFSNNLSVTGTATVGGALGVTSNATVGGTLGVTGIVTIGSSGSAQGVLKLAGASSGLVTVQGASSAGNWTMTLPTTGGTNGYILTTNGSGVTSWTNPTALGIDLDVGSTAITGGTSGRILYDNVGVLGEKAVTGSGDVVLATSPTLITPVLGTPSSGTLSSCSGLPISTGVSGLGTNVATALQVNVGTAGAVLVNGGVLGTPSSGTLSSCSDLPISTGVSGLGTNVATFLGTPSSANLAAALTDETGSGSAVFSTAPTLTGTVLAAGTNSVAPLKLTSGTNLSAASAGAVEYDGTVFTATSVANSRQVVCGEQFVCVGATPVSLTNNITTAQSVFASANDALTVAGSTTYFFEAYIYLSTGTTTHTTAFGLGGTATFTSILYESVLVSSAATTIATSSSFLEVISAAATVLNATSAAATTKIRLKGVMRINAGGTIIPQVTFSAGPTGTCQTNTNSFFRCWPIGSNTVEAVGNWS